MRTIDSIALAALCVLANCTAWSATASSPKANAAPNSAQRVVADHVTVELVGETNSVRAGRAWVGIKLTHEPHWHTYWRNPGDSGLPTRLEWQAPPQMRVGDIAWPAPKRFDLGGLYNFGYDGTVLLMVPIDIPADTQVSKIAALSVTAKWLICNDVCIPGRATLQLDLPVNTNEPVANPGTAALFAAARASLPTAVKPQGRAVESDDKIRIELTTSTLPSELPEVAHLDAFPIDTKLLGNAPLKITRNKDRLTLIAERSDYFESAPSRLKLVLTQKSKDKERSPAWQFDIPWVTEQRADGVK